MLRLTLWNFAEDAQYDIELYENAPVNLNYQFTDVTEINKTKGSYTQTFRIPATKNNTDFFGALSDPAVQTSSALIIGNFNIKRKIRAELNYNSLPLMSGYVQIKAVYKQKKDFADIEIVFFGETIDMASKVGDKMLSDLTTSTIDHTITRAKILDSWVGSSAAPFDGTIRYGIMDKGQNWSLTPGTSTSEAIQPWMPTSSSWDDVGSMWQGDLTPYVQNKWIFARILSEAGFTYTSSFIDGATFGATYMPAFNGSKYPRSTSQEPERQVFGVSTAVNMVLANAEATVPFVDNVGGHNGYDVENNWYNSSNIFVAPYTGFYTFTLNQVFEGGDAICYTEVWQQVNNGSSLYVQSETFHGDGQFTFTRYFDEGRRMYIQAATVGTPTGTESLMTGQVGGALSWFRMDSVTEALQGQDLSLAENFPKCKQIDYLLSLQKMFNLVFIPDKNKPQHLIIEPFEDYTASGTAKDWTNKVDYLKDVVLKPTTDIQKKDYSWSYDQGQDFINTLIQQQTDRVYGRHKVTDPDNAFAVGETKIKTSFAPYVLSNIPNTGFVIHRCITNDGAGVSDPKPRIAFWCGTTDTMGSVFIRDDDMSNNSTVLEMPFFSNYNAVAPSITNDDLNFGYEIDFFFTIANALNTLYYKYWAAYVNQLYSSNSRILTLYIELNNADIQDFEFSDRIYIEDSYYRINKIANYDATQGGSTKVELVKIIQEIADCEFIPTNVALGIIRFAGTGIVYGNQKCCEQYGYTWRPRISRCLANNSTLSPTVI